MSVMVLEVSSWEAVYNKAWNYGFNNTCDINFCSTLKTYDEEELKSLVKDWMWLNEMSFIRRYDEDDKPNLHQFVKFSGGSGVSTYQMYKHLQCIKYNIELATIKNGKTGMEGTMEIPYGKMHSYGILCRAIDEIGGVIISQIEEYKDAQWG